MPTKDLLCSYLSSQSTLSPSSKFVKRSCSNARFPPFTNGLWSIYGVPIVVCVRSSKGVRTNACARLSHAVSGSNP